MNQEQFEHDHKDDNSAGESRIVLWCSYCGQKYRLEQSLAGKKGVCDECHNEFIIPKESQTKPQRKKTVTFACSHCSKKLLRPRELSGKETSCHDCGARNIVPQAADNDSPLNLLQSFVVPDVTRTGLSAVKSVDEEENEEDERVLFWCNHCGQKYRLPKRLYGKTGACVSCKNYIFIPQISQAKPEIKKTVNFLCKECGETLIKGEELIGTEVACHDCGTKNIVPEKSDKSQKGQASFLEPYMAAETTMTNIIIPEDKILFWCSHCGQKYRLPRNLYGKAGICTKCQNYIFIPRVSQTEPPKKKTVVFPCKYCGKKLVKPKILAGEQISCDKCSKKILVPEKSQISLLAKAGSKPENRILFWCSYCSQKYRLPEHLAGKSGTCDKCHKRFIIPEKSQARPQLRKTIVFPCDHCGKELWEENELIGTPVECVRCGEDTIVPEKSKRSFLDNLDTGHFFDIHPQPATMVGDLATRSISAKSRPATVTSPAKAAFVSQKTGEWREPSKRTQIVITDDPPKIYKLKDYLHRKAEKYVLLKIITSIIDYIVDAYEQEWRPLKSFAVIFATFSLAALILVGTWSFAAARSIDENIKSRYNTMCQKCGYREVRRLKDINKQACSRCRMPIGFRFHCRGCDKDFPYRKSNNNSSEESGNYNASSRKCPHCGSVSTSYLTIKKTRTSPKYKK